MKYFDFQLLCCSGMTDTEHTSGWFKRRRNYQLSQKSWCT